MVDTAALRNRFLVGVIITLILGIWIHLGAATTVLWFYGKSMLSKVLNIEYIWNVYMTLLDYWVQYGSAVEQNYPDYQLKVFFPMFGAILMFATTIFFIRAPLFDFRPFQKPEKLHGDAKWATEGEIRKAGLRSKEGVMVGQNSKGYLIAGGYQHTLLFAPTGSGKGVGFVIPNLLFWESSAIVHDIKLENYELTSGWRKDRLKQKVFLWNPASPDGVTHCYNPIDWISHKPGQQVDDVQKIANLLLPEQEFWQNEARSLFLGVCLYLLAVPEKIKSFGEIVRTLRSDDVVYNLAVVLDTIGKQIHPVAYMNLAAFLQKAEKERSGVISTLNSALELWANPLIDTATATSDFNFGRFKKEEITVYVGLTPDNIDRLKPLLQIFYQQATQFMTKHMPRPDEKVGILMLMDEFPTLGKMEQFKTGIAYFRGYRVRLFLIIQDTEQLKDAYEEAGMNSFLANSTYRITFAANNVETANLISQLIGNKTVKQVSRNSPVFLDLNPASRSKHVSEAQRALLLPQEVIGLPQDEQIILIEATPPIRTKKIFYYKDPFFTKRLLPQSFVPLQEPYDPNNPPKVKPKNWDGTNALALPDGTFAAPEVKPEGEKVDSIAFGMMTAPPTSPEEETPPPVEEAETLPEEEPVTEEPPSEEKDTSLSDELFEGFDIPSDDEDSDKEEAEEVLPSFEEEPSSDEDKGEFNPFDVPEEEPTEEDSSDSDEFDIWSEDDEKTEKKASDILPDDDKE